jgi:hypothetical protein
MAPLRMGFIGAGRVADLYAIEYRPPCLSGREGVAVLRFSLAALRSAARGASVRLDVA